MDLVIGFDYQNFAKQLRNLRKAKDFLATANTGPVETGWVTCNYKYSPLNGQIEQIFTLEGEGPFYFLGHRTLRHILAMQADSKFPEIGDIIMIGKLRLKVVANHNRGWPCAFIVMFPDALSVLIYAALPIARWFDLIYRRLIMTAAVWNLAEITPGQWPHRGHLRWPQDEG